MSIQKKLAIAAFGVLLVAGAIILFIYQRSLRENLDVLPPDDAKPITLTCTNGYSGTATYYDADESGVLRRALVVAAKGEIITQHLMRQVPSASGARYATRDQVYSFWEHQGEFTLQQGEVVLAICRDADKQTFILEGEPVTLVKGFAEKEVAPGSVTKDTVRYFGNDATGDINGDGKDDKVFFITKESGGSGVFFYVVGMIATDTLPQGVKAVLIGDRIAPQNLEVRDGLVLVNYADRKPGEPFTAQPSVGKTIRLKLDTVALDFGEVVADFDGEADTNMMTLTMKEWKWIKTTYNDDKEVFPVKKDAFIATFTKEGNASFRTDCNTMNAEYTSTKDSLSFGPMMSTMMFCEGSQEQEYGAMLGEIEKYMFTSRGELILLFKKDSGSMMFK